jgi:hypothetical protein
MTTTHSSAVVRTDTDDGEPESTPNKPRLWRVLATLAVVAVAALAVLVVLWIPSGATKDTLEYELAKICMQVLGVAVIGGAVTFATSTFQQDREAHRRWLADVAERRREKADESDREKRRAAERQTAQVRADADAAIERQRERFEVSSKLMTEATLCAQTMYVTCQHVRRATDDALMQGSQSLDNAKTAALTQLHQSYLTFNARARAIQDELGARLGRRMREDDAGSEAYLRWHQVYDLLTAYYFHLAVKTPQDAFKRNSRGFEGDHHSGLDLAALSQGKPSQLRAEIRSKFEAAMKEFTMALIAETVSHAELPAPSATIAETPS